jgi:hypothetical protein
MSWSRQRLDTSRTSCTGRQQQIMYVMRGLYASRGTATAPLQCRDRQAHSCKHPCVTVTSCYPSPTNPTSKPLPTVLQLHHVTHARHSINAIVWFVACRMLRRPAASSSSNSSCGRRQWQRQWQGQQPPVLLLLQPRLQPRRLRATIPWTGVGSGGCGECYTNGRSASELGA